MTASSSTRSARRAARLPSKAHTAKRGEDLLRAAAALIRFAACDATVNGATLFLPDGSSRYLSLEDAAALVGITPPAGRA